MPLKRMTILTVLFSTIRIELGFLQEKGLSESLPMERGNHFCGIIQALRGYQSVPLSSTRRIEHGWEPVVRGSMSLIPEYGLSITQQIQDFSTIV